MPGIKPECRTRHPTTRCIRRHGGAAQCPRGRAERKPVRDCVQPKLDSVIAPCPCSRRYKLPSLDFRTTIRGINLQGVDFDSLERVSSSASGMSLSLPGDGGDAVGALDPGVLSVPGGRHASMERAHALSLGAPDSIAVVVLSSRKPPDWCCHSLA
jgi:hypothetical protein